MRASKTTPSSSKMVIVALLLFLLTANTVTSQLSLNYYAKTCPRVEQIIATVMAQKQKEAFVTAGGALRIFFHDCFVEGCDASVIIQSTTTNQAEKDADDNLSLPGDGFDAVMRAKAAVEKECPGIVSCADILSIATRDLIRLVGGPFWPVMKGRKDGRVSLASHVAGNLPKPTMSIDQLTQLFQRKGFTQEEMIVLSGGHTIGFTHCNQFMNRIWSNPIDRTMNRTYALQLRQACPNVNLDPTVVVFNDPTTPKTFDNDFYRNLQRGEGVLASDQILWTDQRTRGTVNKYASNNDAFFNAWASVMQKLSLVGVKTGHQGEIRKRCDAIN